MTSFKFTPKSEEELSSLLAEGEAGFEVIESEYKISQKSGKPMFVLKLRIWDVNGEEGTILDFITLDETSKFVMRKLKHLCEATGLKQLYECGEIEASCFKDKSGKLRLGIQKDNIDNNGNPAAPRNCVWDYLAQKEFKKNAVISDDDIPVF